MTTTQERFWSRVEKTDGCWLWRGFVRPDGYGHVAITVGGVRKTILAHRFAVQDQIPDGMDVLHKCDNRVCVKPDHLFFGTHTDNMRDHVSKDRHFFKNGASHPLSKLTETQVRIIKARPREYGVVKQLCAAFGVSRPTVYAIDSGASWGHLPPTTDDDRQRAREFLDSLL